MSKSHELIEEGRLMNRESLGLDTRSILIRYEEERQVRSREREVQEKYSSIGWELRISGIFPEDPQELIEREARAGNQEMAEAAKRQSLADTLRKVISIAVSDPKLEKLPDGFFQLVRPAIVEEENLDVCIILRGVSPSEVRTAHIFVTGLQSHLELDENGGRIKLIGQTESTDATMHDASFYGKVVSGLSYASNPT